MGYSDHFRNTPQSAPLPGRKMVPNAAGGYVFQVEDWQRLRRFLILGCAGGSYYESERRLTLENAEVIRRCLAQDGSRTVKEIVEVSGQGLAPKNDSAIFSLAVATKFGDEPTRKLAFESVPKVCRIGTHLFQFAENREAIGGGWGRGMRRAVANCYNRDDIVHQALKYPQRNGWSHRDLLRLSHPKCEQHAKVFNAICKPDKWSEVDHPLVEGWLKIRSTQDPKAAAQIITDYRLSREMVPTELLTDAQVWEALLPHTPVTALVRNLGNLSKCGLLVPLSQASRFVKDKLTDGEEILRSRLHPFSILVAAKTYTKGQGFKGSGSWTPVPQVVEGLDHAFELAFKNVTPTRKRFLLGVDVSSSMSYCYPHSPMSAAEAAAAMALMIARTEPNYYILGFSSEFKDLGITAYDTLQSALQKTSRHNFGSTDTSVAITWALKNHVGLDVFVILTDNETWAGDEHTCRSLEVYRKQTGIRAKLAVVGFTATGRTIGDTEDLGTMDFVGMDASLPQALAAFVML